VVIWIGIKIKFYFLPFFRIAIFMKKNNNFVSLFLFQPPLHHLHCKYGAPMQAKNEKMNVFRPVSEQNFIPEEIFIFILSSVQICFSLPILLSDQIVRK
jgi:hypothetical protein